MCPKLPGGIFQGGILNEGFSRVTQNWASTWMMVLGSALNHLKKHFHPFWCCFTKEPFVLFHRRPKHFRHLWCPLQGCTDVKLWFPWLYKSSCVKYSQLVGVLRAQPVLVFLTVGHYVLQNLDLDGNFATRCCWGSWASILSFLTGNV